MKHVNDVPGLYISESVLTSEMESDIIKWLDTRKWSTSLSRRTQHFGYIYDYSSVNLEKGDPFESWITNISKWLIANKTMPSVDQCIVNEYYKLQGIGKHIDGKRGNRANIFGPVIVSISLNEDTNFIFTDTVTKKKVEVYAPRRSMIVMSGDSRYTWTHEIPKRSIVNNGDKVIRKEDNYRRISLTFRNIIGI